MRGSGITAYLENGGRLEVRQLIAGHASMSTTQLYDCRDSRMLVVEVERIL
jgi:site-specific recombinase XerD